MKKIVFILFLSVILCGTAIADTTSNAANAGAMAGASIDSHDNINSIDKKFANPGITPIPGLTAFTTTPTPDSSFRTIKDLFRHLGYEGKSSIPLTKGALKEMASGGDVDVNLQIIRGKTQVERLTIKDDHGAKWFWLCIEDGNIRPTGITTTGLIDAEADDGDTNSMQVIGKAALKAMADGNTHMVITVERWHRMAESEGVGVGLYAVAADVSGSGEASQVGGGGTGWAKNWASTEDCPWIKGYVGVKKMEAPQFTRVAVSANDDDSEINPDINPLFRPGSDR